MGAGGMGGMAGAGGAGGAGGMGAGGSGGAGGGGPMCVTPADCPSPGTPCAVATCEAGACGTSFVAAGTATANQQAGDCRVEQCDGAGSTMSAVDANDTPNDGNVCTSDLCDAGIPLHPPLPADTACNVNDGKLCDGNGACVECNSGPQCPSGVCMGHVCQPASCDDGVKNGTETDVDCGGGTCLPCASGQACTTAADCQTGACIGGLCDAPAVVSTTPADAATGVAAGATVAVTFSMPMAPATLGAQTDIGPCTGTIQLSTDDFATCLGFAAATPTMSNGGTVATLVPAPALSYGTTYKLRVTTAAKDPYGNALGAAYTQMTGFATGAPPPSCIGSVVISQVYGYGGEFGATYLYDYIELHNRGKTPVSLKEWSLQFASGTGLFYTSSYLTSKTIPPGGYFLVQEGSGLGSYGTWLPVPPDVTHTASVYGGQGKVALVSSYTQVSGDCPLGNTSLVDFIGYGSSVSCYEYEDEDDYTPGPYTPDPKKSLFRVGDGCTDTNNNEADFVVGTAAPRSSFGAAHICDCGAEDATVNESDLPAEIDYCNLQFPLSVTVAAGQTTPVVYGRVYEADITNLNGVNATVKAEVGYGPANVNPTSQSGWQWFPATFNMQYGNDDEYKGSFTAPAAGTYRYTYRVSLDGGRWTYCDMDGAGSNPGLRFDPAKLPVLTVTP
ncbi:Ig-like domain-containing protein, partial [Polyangium sp. 15x6]|uniref:Ig-like domain-containing protein n=1 Tax=Polyangium sp. 15x6 TaxID=3042687 RepID=UPI00249B052C